MPAVSTLNTDLLFWFDPSVKRFTLQQNSPQQTQQIPQRPRSFMPIWLKHSPCLKKSIFFYNITYRYFCALPLAVHIFRMTEFKKNASVTIVFLTKRVSFKTNLHCQKSSLTETWDWYHHDICVQCLIFPRSL